MPTPPPVPLTGGVDWGRAWHAAFEEATECARLDEELAKLDAATRRHFPLLARDVRARVTRWLAHLAAPAPTLAWRRGRNEHARALAAALARGRLPAPFDAAPPDGAPGAQLWEGRRRAGRPELPRRVPGTTLPLPAASAALPGLDAAVAALAPSQVALAAELGAARQRAVELEARLADADARLARVEGGSGGRAAAAALADAARRLQSRVVDVEAAVGKQVRPRTPRPAARPRSKAPPTPSPQPQAPPVDVAALRARIAAL